ncbi:MAG TPA: transcriptional regulator [Nitrospiraceae bacterium]|nr:transcriptional regulator [Nitrospiraceae bacterium]HBI23884.1 transcriptional regulator [Nitrospiraceae bacterium]
MDDKSLKTLEILEELSSNGQVTQRELSRKVGIALGLANFYIKRLVQKGYVEVIYLEKNRLDYLITPKGIAEKSRLTYNYIQRSYRYVRKVRIRMREHLKELARDGVGTVVIYGGGDMAEVAYLALQEVGIKLTAVVDDDRKGRPFLGYTILPVSSIPQLSYDRIIVTEAIAVQDVGNLFQEYGIGEDRLIHME